MKTCPYCTAELADEALKCMHCGEWVAEPSRDAAVTPNELRLTIEPPTRSIAKKKCPYCSAEIPKDAWTCMYCKRAVLGGRPLFVGIAAAAVLFMAVMIFGVFLPARNRMNQLQMEFDESQKEFDKELMEQKRRAREMGL